MTFDHGNQVHGTTSATVDRNWTRDKKGRLVGPKSPGPSAGSGPELALVKEMLAVNLSTRKGNRSPVENFESWASRGQEHPAKQLICKEDEASIVPMLGSYLDYKATSSTVKDWHKRQKLVIHEDYKVVMMYAFEHARMLNPISCLELRLVNKTVGVGFVGQSHSMVI